MGHGIFPNYGPTYIKSWQNKLSREEMKAVFYPDKKSLKSSKIRTSLKEEEDNNNNFRKKKK
jgi:hypothetical protein